MPIEAEVKIVLAKVPSWNTTNGIKVIQKMVALAGLTRSGFMAGDISTIMSPRTVITWAENAEIIGDINLGFNLYGIAFKS